MSDAVMLGLFAMLTAVIAPCLLVIVKRLAEVHKVVNSKMTEALSKIDSLEGEIRGLRAAPLGKGKGKNR